MQGLGVLKSLNKRVGLLGMFTLVTKVRVGSGVMCVGQVNQMRIAPVDQLP